MTRIHVYPWHGTWVVEEMSDWQAFLNDLKLFGLYVALFNVWAILIAKRHISNNVVEFRSKK